MSFSSLLFLFAFIGCASALSCHVGFGHKTVVMPGFKYCLKTVSGATKLIAYSATNDEASHMDGRCLISPSEDKTDFIIDCYCQSEECNAPASTKQAFSTFQEFREKLSNFAKSA